MRYETLKQDVSLFQNEFILLNPHDRHRQLRTEKHKFLIELERSFLNDISNSFQVQSPELCFALSSQKHPQIAQWVHFVHQYIQVEMEGGDDESLNLFLDHSFHQLGLLLYKNCIGTHTYDLRISSFRGAHSILYKTMDAIKQNYKHQWSLDEMAEVAYLSKYQFSHLFKETTGVAPYSWLQLYRLVRSQQWLVESNKSIIDIALDSGFSSVSVYNQLFKRVYGFTPNVFRKQMNK